MPEQTPPPETKPPQRKPTPEEQAIINRHQEWIRDCYDEYVKSIETIPGAKLQDDKRAHHDDPRRANFTFQHLENIELSWANLRGASFIETHLEHAILFGTHLEHSFLFGAHLESANMNGAHLEYSNLHAVHFEHTELLSAHLNHAVMTWAQLKYSRLNQANLEYVDLREAHLEHAVMIDANLTHTDLRETNLEYAYLSGARLRGSDLSDATLVNAKVSKGNFTGVKFFVTNIRSCDFSYAEFRHWKIKNENGEEITIETEGLYDSQFADCDLTGARLPEGVAKFESLAMMNESTKSNKRLLWELLLLCFAFPLLLTIHPELSFTTLGLSFKTNLTPESSFNLIAIIGFGIICYWHFHLLLNMQRHWELLDHLPSKFPDGLTCEKRIQPWFVNAFILNHRTYIDEKPPLYYIQYWLISGVVWWVAPAALLIIHALFFPKNNVMGVFFFQTAISTSCVLALHFFRQAKSTLRGEKAPFLDFPWEFWKEKKDERIKENKTWWQQFRSFTWKEQWTYSRPALEVVFCIILLAFVSWFEKIGYWNLTKYHCLFF